MKDLFKSPNFKYIVIPTVWISNVLLVSLLIAVVIKMDTNQKALAQDKYAILTAEPHKLVSITAEIQTEDPRITAINATFKKFKCPIQGTGDIFVREADKNNIPYWFVASIAFQESSCGKNTPKVDGVDSHNMFGWGVWGNHVKMFDDREHGIAVVSKYMGERFFSQGITETCDIMKIYTPPSNGSWCKGINYFRDIIEGYNNPVDNT